MIYQGNIQLHTTVEDAELGIKAIAITGQGKQHTKLGCQDSSCVYVTANKSVGVFVCSDGHSSAKYGRDGADAICSVLRSVLDNYEDAGACEEDIVRYFQSRYGKRAILKKWLDAITNLESKRLERYISGEDRFKIASAYGATLNAFIVTKNYIISMSVGDGSMVGIDQNGKFYPIFVDEEDGISTGRTLSLCNLNSEYLNVRVNARTEMHYLFALTDGYTKNYDLFEDDSTLKQVADIYKEWGWKQTTEDIVEFMQSEDIVNINDDVSMVFVALENVKTESAAESWKNAKGSLFYDYFKITFDKIGEEKVGIYHFISDRELLDAADVLINAVKELNQDKILITNPVDDVLVYDENHKVFSIDKTQLFGQEQLEAVNKIRYPEFYMICDGYKESVNNVYLAGMLFKLFGRERLMPSFLLYKEWKDRKQITFEHKNNCFFDEESLLYLESIYNHKCREEDVWTPEKWQQKLEYLWRKIKLKKEKKKVEKEIKILQEVQVKTRESLRDDQELYSKEKEVWEKKREDNQKQWEQLEQQKANLKLWEDKLKEDAKNIDEDGRRLESFEKSMEDKEKDLCNNEQKIIEKKARLEEMELEEKRMKENKPLEIERKSEWGVLYLISNQKGCKLNKGNNPLSWGDFGLEPCNENPFRIVITDDGQEEEVILYTSKEVRCRAKKCEICKDEMALYLDLEQCLEQRIEIDGLGFLIKKDESI